MAPHLSDVGATLALNGSKLI